MEIPAGCFTWTDNHWGGSLGRGSLWEDLWGLEAFSDGQTDFSWLEDRRTPLFPASRPVPAQGSVGLVHPPVFRREWGVSEGSLLVTMDFPPGISCRQSLDWFNVAE